MPSSYMDMGIPYGIEIDDNGNQYVVDYMNSKVLVFDDQGDLIDSFGKRGNNIGDFNGPISELTIDNNGYIYVGGDCYIYKYSPSGSFVSRWGECGSNDGQISYIKGIHYDSNQNRIIITDTGNNRVQVFSKNGTYIGKFGTNGTGNGQFNSPFGITTDSTGNIYVVDSDNHRVQKFSKTFNYITSFGSEGFDENQLLFPKDVKIDGNNRVIVTSQNSQKIYILNSNLEFQSRFGEEGSLMNQLNLPQYIGIDSANNIYVTDWGQNAIKKFNSSGIYQSMIGNGKKIDGQLFNPMDIAYDSEGNMYVLEDGAFSARVQKFTNSGTYIETIIEPDTLPYSAYYIMIDEFDKVYISHANGVDVFDINGTSLDAIGGTEGSGNGEFIQARGIAFDSSGNVYVADYGNSRVQVFDGSYNFIATIGTRGTGNGQFVAPTAVMIDEHDTLYVADVNDGGVYETETEIARIQKFLTSGTYLETIATAGENFQDFRYINDMEMDDAGNIYVSDRDNNVVRYIDSNGNYMSIYGEYGSGLDQFYHPMGLERNPLNYILSIVDSSNHRILTKPAGTRIFNLDNQVDVLRVDNGDSLNKDYVALTDPDRASIEARLNLDNKPIALFNVDMQADRNWESVRVSSIPQKSKVLVMDLDTAAGILTAPTIYVPKYAGQDKLLICPDAQTISEINHTCDDKYVVTVANEGISVIELNSQEYWEVSGYTDNGFMSYSTLRLDLSTTTNTVYINQPVNLTITPLNEQEELDSYYVGNVEIVSNPYTTVVHKTVSINQETQPISEPITFDQPGVYTVMVEDIYNPNLSDTSEQITVLGIQDVNEEEEEPTNNNTNNNGGSTTNNTTQTCNENPNQDKCIVTAYINNVLFKQIDNRSAQICWEQNIQADSFVKLLENGVVKEEKILGESTDGIKYCVSITDLLALNKYDFSIIVNQIKESENIQGEYTSSFSMQEKIEENNNTDNPSYTDKDSNKGESDKEFNLSTVLITFPFIILFIIIVIYVMKKLREKR